MKNITPKKWDFSPYQPPSFFALFGDKAPPRPEPFVEEVIGKVEDTRTISLDEIKNAPEGTTRLRFHDYDDNKEIGAHIEFIKEVPTPNYEQLAEEYNAYYNIWHGELEKWREMKDDWDDKQKEASEKNQKEMRHKKYLELHDEFGNK